MEKAPQKQKISTYKKMAWLVFPQCMCSVKVIIKSPITDNEGDDTACPSAAPATITAQHNNYVARFIYR